MHVYELHPQQSESDAPRKIVQPKGLYADIYEYFPHSYTFRYVDYQTVLEYINPYTYRVIVRRLDGGLGSLDNLKVMVCNETTDTLEIIYMGCWNDSYDGMRIVHSNTILEPDTDNFVVLSNPRDSNWAAYSPSYTMISREVFNEIFDTDIVTLPSSMFAIGCESGRIYMYHEGNGIKSDEFKNIKEPCTHLLRVWNGMKLETPVYYIISSTDGFMESVYHSNYRTIPRIVGEYECLGKYLPVECGTAEYLVFHKHKIVLGQSIHKGMPYAIGVPDRHYFFHNLNNSFVIIIIKLYYFYMISYMYPK